MNISKILLTGATLLVAISIQAQQSMTLEECVSFALENHLSLKNSVLEEKKADYQIVETRSIGLPQVNGKIQGVGNIEVQPQFIPEGSFGVIPGVTPDPEKVQAFALGVPYSATASITVSQMLFNSSYLVGLEAAKTYRMLSVQNTEKNKENVKIDVIKAYYGALVNKQRRELLIANKAQVARLQSDAEIMVKEGVMEPIELSKLSVSLNNLITQIEKVEAVQRISENLLKFNMGMPLTEEIELVDKLEEVLKETGATTSPELNVDNRLDFQLMKTQMKVNKLQLKDYKLKSLPDASLFANVGSAFGAIKFEKNPLIGKGNWANYGNVGFVVNVPIFTSFKNRSLVNQSKVDIDILNNQMALAKQSYELEYNQHIENYLNYKSSLERLEKNQQLAQDVYDNAQIKYKNGVGSSYDIVVAETQLKEAQTNYLGAIYDLLVTKVDLEQASGNFK